MDYALEASALTMQFGGLKAVSALDLKIPKGTIFGLIGPNGAGKTTAFNMLTGVYEPTSGLVHGFGQKLNGLKPYEITAKGLARTFQNIRLFKELSVLKNLMVAMDHHPDWPRFGWFSMILHTKKSRTIESQKIDACLKILDIFGMRER